jgi:hypothetical protein
MKQSITELFKMKGYRLKAFFGLTYSLDCRILENIFGKDLSDRLDYFFILSDHISTLPKNKN